MKTAIFLVCFTAAFAFENAAQTSVPINKSTQVSDGMGTVSGRTYTNKDLNFEVTFPDTWLIPGPDFEEHMRSQGFDLSLKIPDGISGVGRVQAEQALERVKILLTAYRSMPGTENNAIVRISVENLSLNPAVKDAVDYFDLMRAQFAVMKLPADFRYSQTQAEQLGKMQFGYIDSWNDSGKKRMYATVRKGVALMFTISYSDHDDLITLRKVLSDGNFKLQ